MLLTTGTKLIMIGDSVTDCGRAQPAGEGLFGALGNGYVSLIDGYLSTVYPELSVRVINKGTSGNNVRSLAERWQADVIDMKPDWLAVMIGINDVWRQFDTPRIPEGHVLLAEYRMILENLIAQTRPLVQGLVLMTPYYMEPNRHDPMRETMDHYGLAVREIAARHDCILVDTQVLFDDLFLHMHPNNVAWDRVHPNHIGATLLSRAFLKAVGALDR